MFHENAVPDALAPRGDNSGRGYTQRCTCDRRRISYIDRTSVAAKTCCEWRARGDSNSQPSA